MRQIFKKKLYGRVVEKIAIHLNFQYDTDSNYLTLCIHNIYRSLYDCLISRLLVALHVSVSFSTVYLCMYLDVRSPKFSGPNCFRHSRYLRI